ncbi:MAG: aldehyde dehydrogenase family protein [Actinoplanes sp.]
MSEDADQGRSPYTGQPVGEAVPHTTEAELDALRFAGPLPLAGRAELLEAVAAALEDARDELVPLADAETGLGETRLGGELTRTRAQLEMFAEVVREGSFLEVIVDHADPATPVAPRPDLRRMLIPVGPVAVYAASNFPFAFSVAGGDTASALAAGCPVVVKAHPGHPGLSRRTGQIVGDALTRAGAPAGTFTVVHGMDAGLHLVRHPAIRAAGFTGSLQGGRALYDLANARPDPIPFYGELGSLNPVVVTPGALASRGSEIVTGFVGSFTLGAGQFCTKPGLLFLPRGHGRDAELAAAAGAVSVGPLLNDRIQRGFEQVASKLAATDGVRLISGRAFSGPLPAEAGQVPPRTPAAETGPPSSQPLTADASQPSAQSADAGQPSARSADAGQPSAQSADAGQASPQPLTAGAGSGSPLLLAVAAGDLSPDLLEECFGPASLVVEYGSAGELARALDLVPGALTATVHADPDTEQELIRELLARFADRAGRVIFGGWPTGVAVTRAQQHGGPWPATTNALHTSVGATGIRRWLRPVAYQDVPDAYLPEPLQDANPLGIPRRTSRPRM